MDKTVELIPGTLDLLILKAVSLGPLHGYGVLLRIQQICRGALRIQQGSLYPALYKLEAEGLISSTWGQSENNRRAKYYDLTESGRARFLQESQDWTRIVAVMSAALRA
jgi:PadR family transcriptional regulator, regulatory protein PadR